MMETLTLTVRNFPAKLRNRIRAEAMLRNTNMADLLVWMVEDWLDEHGSTTDPVDLDEEDNQHLPTS